MAIPISEYIDIRENVFNAEGGIDLVGLVISSETMVTGASTKSAYEGGDVVTLSRSEAISSFGTGNTKTILTAYGASKVKLIYKDEDSTYADAFNAALDKDGSFCAFACDTVMSASDTGTLAAANAALGFQHVFVAAFDDTTKTAVLALTDKCLLKVYVDLGESNDLGQVGAVLGWAANIDHTAVNGASTLMYKDLGVDATVKDLSVKTTMDAGNCNYCGLVQTHGRTRKFFQMGRCADGTDAGVVLSSIYMTASIENAWIALAMGMNKIPANSSGAAIVRGIVTSVAETALTNGAILVDKELTNEQKALILEYTGNQNAVTAIQNIGYYVSANIKIEGLEYICQYTLVYAKGDHIAKVEGSHFLV